MVNEDIPIPFYIEDIVFEAFLCYKMGKLFRDGGLKAQRYKELQVLYLVIQYIDRKYINDWCEVLFGSKDSKK
ncbi:MAG: hypothetical protein ACE5HR_00170 [bacterium]